MEVNWQEILHQMDIIYYVLYIDTAFLLCGAALPSCIIYKVRKMQKKTLDQGARRELLLRPAIFAEKLSVFLSRAESAKI